MITWGLAARLGGTGVTVNAAAPGFVRTEFNRHARGFTAAMVRLFARLMAVSPAEGADTPLWVATAPELQGVTGKYFSGRKERPDRFRDQELIADLEQQCREMVANSAQRATAPGAGASSSTSAARTAAPHSGRPL
jgi:NAD(P)-dependent dehydrogenase (short-subunit alcohol dehydrogenase family)